MRTAAREASIEQTNPLNNELATKYRLVREEIRTARRAVVAFSGGVDSSLVAYIAGDVLGENAIAVTSGSKSLKRSDLKLAQELAQQWGLRHRVIVTDELSKADYRANPTNRCFHCKTSLYESLTQIARDEGIQTIYNGTNIDDLGDHRPGLVAADNFRVTSPLVSAGFSKQDIRDLAAHLGLSNAMKPQSACLSSRFPYGTAIDEAKLAMVEAAEERLQAIGFSQFRVRHHGEVARLELVPAEFELAVSHGEQINAELQALGYRYVALDLQGFRSGSLNESLSAAVKVVAAKTGAQKSANQIDAVQLYDA